MGALTNNRKRGDDYFKTSVSMSPTIENSCGRSLKRQKISVTTEQRTPDRGQFVSSSSVGSRIAQYPDLKTGFRREVHAPVRSSRFWNYSSPRNSEVAASSKEGSSNGMGAFSKAYRVYDKLKGVAMRTLRFYDVKEDVPVVKQKAKEVIEIDNEEEKPNDLSDDSSLEELENKDFTESRWKAGQGIVENSQEPNLETLEKEVRSLDSSLVSDGSNANTKVDDMEKMALVQSYQVPDVSGLPPYRRMLEEANKRTNKLSGLQYMIELIEKRIQGFTLLRPHKKKEEIKDVAAECFVPLKEDEKKEISRALSNVNRRKILVKHENSNIDITGEILQCLRPGAWLNDEVINLYLELLKEREKREPQKFLKCHFFNTFFYKKLNGRGVYNFQSVRRWTTKKKLEYSLIDCDKIFVPIHKEVHWCLAIINKKDKKFQYLDSLKGNDARVLDVLSRYFADEVKDKCAKDIDISSWDKEFVEDLPEQQNGFDCGMFMIKYADFYSRDIGLCFSQEHMPYFRLRTAKEILRLKAD